MIGWFWCLIGSVSGPAGRAQCFVSVALVTSMGCSLRRMISFNHGQIWWQIHGLYQASMTHNSIHIFGTIGYKSGIDRYF